MRLGISDVKELVKAAHAFCILGKEIFCTNSRRKDPASWIPPCAGYFTRTEDAEIRKKFKTLCQGGKGSSVVKTLLLHGPSGHGKNYSATNLLTTICISRTTNSFISRADQGKPKLFLEKSTIRWTLNATNKRTLFESYRSLAEAIGLNQEATDAYMQLPLHNRTSEGRLYQMLLRNLCEKNAHDEALEQIYEKVMKELGKKGSWVLYIKGSTTEKVACLRRFWPQPGESKFGKGLVIMTTGDGNSKLLFGDEDDSILQKVYIGKMTDEDSAQFLQRKTGITAAVGDRKNAKDIAVEMLKRSPQDIAKFGAFVKNYREETNEKLTYKDLVETKTESLYECMLLLEMTRKKQEKLLKFLACCSGEADYLPLQCLERCFEDAKETIKQSNFVDVLERLDGVKVVTMHERDHKTLRSILIDRKPAPSEKNWSGFLWQLLNQWIPNGDKTIKIIPPTLTSSDVLQAIKCLSSNFKDALQQSRDQDFFMLPKILPHLKEAVELSHKLIPERELEKNQLVMADGHACLGEMLLFVGKSEEARKNLEIALRGFKDYCGPENVLLDKANVLHFLGEAYRNSNLGDPSKGERYLKRALKGKEQYYKGKADHQVAFTLRSLANVLNEMGKHNEAKVFAKRAVAIHFQGGYKFRQEYGYSVSTLGSSYRYLGRYVQAERRLKESLKIARSVDAPSKLRMGETLSRLSSVQRNLEKLDESIESLMEAKEMFGNNDIYSAIILSKLSVVYRHKGDSKNSLENAEKAAEITDKHHGLKSHPVIATALLNLGNAQSDTGSVENAERNLIRALEIYKEIHGENHGIIAANLNYLGCAYLQKGQVWKAKETLENAVKIMDNYSPSHQEMANSLKRLSKTCLILGEAVNSADLANRAREIYNETYENKPHREVRKCTLRIAYACSKLGLFSKAKEYIKEVELGFSQKNMAHPEYAVFLRTKTEITLDNLQFSWPKDEKGMRKMMSEAETDLNRADVIIQQSLGCDHQQYAFLKGEKARLCILMGHYKKAYNEIHSALSIIAKNYQKPDIEAGFLLIRADAEGKLQLSCAQEESLARAEKLYEEAFDDSHPMVATTLQKRCQKNIDLTNLSRAEEDLAASDKICEIHKTSLRRQLDSSCSGFLANYSLDHHPVLKRQQQLNRRIKRGPAGAWFQ